MPKIKKIMGVSMLVVNGHIIMIKGTITFYLTCVLKKFVMYGVIRTHSRKIPSATSQ